MASTHFIIGWTLQGSGLHSNFSLEMHSKKANHNFGVATKSSVESQDLSKVHENAERRKKSVVFLAIFLKNLCAIPTWLLEFSYMKTRDLLGYKRDLQEAITFLSTLIFPPNGIKLQCYSRGQVCSICKHAPENHKPKTHILVSRNLTCTADMGLTRTPQWHPSRRTVPEPHNHWSPPSQSAVGQAAGWQLQLRQQLPRCPQRASLWGTAGAPGGCGGKPSWGWWCSCGRGPRGTRTWETKVAHELRAIFKSRYSWAWCYGPT